MTQHREKKVPEVPTNSVENILNQRLSRRQALGRGAAIAIGAGVVVVGAAGYLAYISTQGGTTTSTTQSSSSSLSTTTTTTPPTTTTTPPTTSTSLSTSTSETTTSSSGSWSYPSSWTTPSSTVKFDVWNFRPDLVQKSVDLYNQEFNENAKVELIAQNYFAVVETKLLSSDLDMSYNTPDGAAKEYSLGLTHNMDDIVADSPTGRIGYSVKDIKAEINKDYPSFVDAYTTLDGKSYFGLPYYQSVLGALLANNKILSAAGLQPASGYDPTMWPQNYTDLYAQIDTIQQKGAADKPLLPLWYQAYPGWGISQGFMAENVNINGWKSLFTDAPDLKPTFDTNTGVADVLKNWKHVWDQTQIPKDIITESSDGNVDGLFQSGVHAFAIWWLYNLWPYNTPSVSKIAGFAHPVPPNKNGWGYYVQQGILMREETKDAAYFERMKALLIYMAYKDRTGAYQNPLNIAAHAGIAAHTAFAAVNVGPEVQAAWTAALPDPQKEVPVMNEVLKGAAFNQSIRAHWGLDWMVALTDNLPKFLQGDIDLNTTITTLRKKADTLSVS